jgi:serine/threonine protein kinase
MNRISLCKQNPDAKLTFPERPGVEFKITKKEIGRGVTCIVYHAISFDNTEHLLKEYYPRQLDLSRDSVGRIIVPADKEKIFEQGLVNFRKGCEWQKQIRLSNQGLKNFTCNVQGYYKANGTEYIDMTCFSGQTYDHVQEKSVHDLMLRMKTLAQVAGNYHKAGLLHLDIKPENIYVRPDGETIEDVMLFDFDSVTPMKELSTTPVLSCTKAWAAPEQLLPKKWKNIGPATDLFAIGEIIFVQLFGRHSTSAERRSFVTKYAYDHNADIFKGMNPELFSLLDELLCHTICSVVNNRYQSAEELIAKLDEISDLSCPSIRQSMSNCSSVSTLLDSAVDTMPNSTLLNKEQRFMRKRLNWVIIAAVSVIISNLFFREGSLGRVIGNLFFAIEVWVFVAAFLTSPLLWQKVINFCRKIVS